MPEQDKNLLVIGNRTALNIVIHALLDRLYDGYTVTSYAGDRVVDWSAGAIIDFIAEHPQDFAAILVDYGESQAGQAVRDGGYTGPVVGLVSYPADQIPGATTNFDIHNAFHEGAPQLGDLLDELTSQSGGVDAGVAIVE